MGYLEVVFCSESGEFRLVAGLVELGGSRLEGLLGLILVFLLAEEDHVLDLGLHLLVRLVPEPVLVSFVILPHLPSGTSRVFLMAGAEIR